MCVSASHSSTFFNGFLSWYNILQNTTDQFVAVCIKIRKNEKKKKKRKRIPKPALTFIRFKLNTTQISHESGCGRCATFFSRVFISNPLRTEMWNLKVTRLPRWNEEKVEGRHVMKLHSESLTASTFCENVIHF